MKYNTLRIIRQLLKNELEGMEREMIVLNNELKKLDPDGLLPETQERIGYMIEGALVLAESRETPEQPNKSA